LNTKAVPNSALEEEFEVYKEQQINDTVGAYSRYGCSCDTHTAFLVNDKDVETEKVKWHCQAKHYGWWLSLPY
jgi:hypothetical protein